MTDRRVRSVVIVGGGTAGWMAAASLCKSLQGMAVAITLVESDRIGSIGVGEATVPPIMEFIRQLGINEDELIREVEATYKLGIGFRDWSQEGDYYFHPFGASASGIGSIPFQAYWLKMFLAGKAAPLEEYSIQAMAAAQGRFARPVHAPNTPLNKITYALHFDASKFARFLRRFAEVGGVKRIEGEVVGVSRRGEDGFVESLQLRDGSSVAADLYLDCTGFRGMLIEETLKSGYENWSHWLPCDRAVVVHSKPNADPAPYTLVTARDAGWQWRIPLQRRNGNGYVYSEAFCTGEAAQGALMEDLGGAAMSEPTTLRFVPGRRRKAWNRNVVALGLSAGFLEPLEATSIHLIQRGIAMLLRFFPDRDFAAADIERYNQSLEGEFSRIRDFLLLHYSQTQRRGAFWEHCRAMPLTESLREKIDLFKSHGRLLREEAELFPINSWLSIMIGQKIIPARYDPMVDSVDAQKIVSKLEELRTGIRGCVEAMPSLRDFLQRSATPVGRPVLSTSASNR
jgi:tryptophan 7-halogenase